VGLVLRQGTGLAAAGLGLGLAGAVATTRLLAGQLYGVEAHDWSLFALGIGLLLAVTALAMFVPAWRATQVDPMAALRHE